MMHTRSISRSRNAGHLRRRVDRRVDWIFVGVVVLLTALGLVMAYSTTFFWSQVDRGSPLAIFGNQVLYAALGLVAFAVLARLDYGIFRRFAVWIMLGCLVTLIAVLLFGDDVFGARRTFLNGSVQPSEPVKLAVIVYAAAWLASRRDQVQSIANGLIPFGVIVGVVCFLVVIQPDLSTTVVIVIIAMTMFFMAGASGWQLMLLGSVVVSAFLMLITLVPYAAARVEQFIKVWRTPAEADYHTLQLLITLGGGGVFGNGIGASGQKFGYLPTPHTDSVIAVLGDEMGLVGLLITLTLFALFAWRGLHIAHAADTAFGSFVAVGVVIWVVGQMLLNVLAVMALIPFTGVNVPFLSMGGSSLVSLLAACGIVVSISRGSYALREDGAQEGLSGGIQGGKIVRASATIRGRNSRTRFARAHRAQGAGSAAGIENAETTIVGRDVRTGYIGANGVRPRRIGCRGGSAWPQRLRDPGVVRWRGRRHGA